MLRTGLGLVAIGALVALTLSPAIAATPRYDITTLAGKVASLHGTAGLQVRFSAFLEEEAEEEDASAPGPITPDLVLTSPLDARHLRRPDRRIASDPVVDLISLETEPSRVG